jgi:hypothetical protein
MVASTTGRARVRRWTRTWTTALALGAAPLPAAAAPERPSGLAAPGPSTPAAMGGLTRALQFTSLATLGFADVPANKLAPATAMSGTVQQLGQALGVVLGSLTLEAAMLATGAAAPGAREFAISFLVAGVVVLGSIPSALRMRPEPGAQVSGHRG